VLFLFNGRLRVLFDTLLLSCGAEAFLVTVVGVFRSFVEGFFDTEIADDANWGVDGFFVNEELETFLLKLLRVGSCDAEALLLTVWASSCELDPFFWIIEEGT